MKFQLSNPLKWQIVTQGFGQNYADFYSKWGLKGHNGLDLRADRGTGVYATHDGIVLESKDDPGGFGSYIYIQTQRQFDSIIYGTVYGHLLSRKVERNQLVKSGDFIALTDNTGIYTTGDHLHFGLYALDKDGNSLYPNNGYRSTIDPVPFFSDSGWDLLPVQKRYLRIRKDGTPYYYPSDTKKRPWDGWKMEGIKAFELTRYLRTLPTHEQINAVVYGAWPREWIANDAFFPIYATLTYAEYKAGKKPPIRVTT